MLSSYHQKIVWGVIILLMTVSTLNSQNIEFTPKNFKGRKAAYKKAVSALEKGDSDFMKNSYEGYESALHHYLEAHEINPKSADLTYKIGFCYLNINDVKNSLDFLELSKELDSVNFPDIYYTLALAYHRNGQFEEAIKMLNAYEKKIDKKLLRFVKEDLLQMQTYCENGIDIMKNPVYVSISNLGPTVNSEFPEYGPVITADDSVMFFTARRKETTGGKTDKVDNYYYEDIYKTNRTEDGWAIPANIGGPINTKFHDAVVGISPDGQQLLLYKTETGMGDIYLSKLQGEKWDKPERLPTPINSNSTESSASFSFDGRTIYFDSNRPGGYGGKDIYVSKLLDSVNWSEAQNIGAAINTEGDEEGVFIHPDGKTLYFSSSGHKTIGGSDVFMTQLTDSGWNIPKNLGFPINSPDDDKFISIAANGKIGYYSSIKPEGYGLSDLYRIEFLDLIEDTLDKISGNSKVTLVKGTILDKNGKPMKAIIEIIDNSSNEVIAVFQTNEETGKYMVALPSGKNYGIYVKADDYLFYSENFDINQEEGYQDVVMDIKMKEIEKDEKIILKNIFYETGKFKIREESYGELQKIIDFMNGHPSVKIEISGHTDNVGSASFNKTLSQKRADQVVAYILSKGIEKNRIHSIGYGLEKPIAPNDTEEGRKKNRRTEFKIIEK